MSKQLEKIIDEIEKISIEIEDIANDLIAVEENTEYHVSISGQNNDGGEEIVAYTFASIDVNDIEELLESRRKKLVKRKSELLNIFEIKEEFREPELPEIKMVSDISPKNVAGNIKLLNLQDESEEGTNIE